MRHSHPAIAEEFARVSDELRAGRSRTDALRALGERTGVGGVKSFAALAIQTEALGTSIAQTLRTYSVEMRETRFLRAEEKALRIPVLMTIPLVSVHPSGDRDRAVAAGNYRRHSRSSSRSRQPRGALMAGPRIRFARGALWSRDSALCRRLRTAL